ncbi:MAG: GIY-YIG nuclease family protein [Alphaproteobacteria bacterium]|nr:GIY-YIG nuclease family protein [Alphaproteobacteria bacterium]
MGERKYYVYMLANKYNNVLYIGVTGNIKNRTIAHKTHINKGFSSKYNCDKLVYYEEFNEITEAIIREKRLKKWKREYKDALINRINPLWEDMWENVMMQ